MTGLFNFFKKDKRGYSENERREMLKEQDYSCVRCGGRINIRTAEADHKYPHSAGGSTDRCNGQMLCHDCHVKKSNSERGVYYGHQKKPRWNFSRQEKPDKYEKKPRWSFLRQEKPDKYEKKTWGNSFGNNYFKPQKKSNNVDPFGSDFFGTGKPKRRRKKYF